jgi:hypothetical protein
LNSSQEYSVITVKPIEIVCPKYTEEFGEKPLIGDRSRAEPQGGLVLLILSG